MKTTVIPKDALPLDIVSYLSQGGRVEDNDLWVDELCKLFIIPKDNYLLIELTADLIVVYTIDRKMVILEQAKTIAGLLNVIVNLEVLEQRGATYVAMGGVMF